MVDLDNPTLYPKTDPAEMREHLRGLPRQCARAWHDARQFDLPPDYTSVDKVVVLGMGGSAIGGELLRSLALEGGRGPVIVHRDYDLPAFVDSQTLVIGSSYSGETEETLTAFARALATPAKKLALTTGGRLRVLAEGAGVPVFLIDYKGAPRAALGYGFLPLVAFLQKLGFLPSYSQEVEEAVSLLEMLSYQLEEGRPTVENPAKKLALRLKGRLPIIYGAGLLAEVARRWSNQFNENSKAWAFYQVLPELNHNAIVGYPFPREMRDTAYVVLLRSSLLHPRTRLRYQITGDILTQAGLPHETVEASGQSRLAQMLSLLFLGDYVSYYLACLYETDPSPVPVIDYLKRRLAESPVEKEP